MSDPFIGEIRPVGWNFAARGWAFCSGSLLPISSNTALFSLFGTLYGGDGRSTFGLPDLQGRNCGHSGRGPGLTTRNMGQKLGANSTTLTVSEIPAHGHPLFASSDGATTGNPAGAYPPTLPAGLNLYQSSSSNIGPMDSLAVRESGGGQAHDNNQPFLVVNYLVALNGLYPSRS